MAEDLDDDPLLRALGVFAREEEAREEALLGAEWERLAGGSLSPEEESGLKSRTRDEMGLEEAEQRFVSFLPLEESFRARVAARILEELGTSTNASPEVAAVPVSHPKLVRPAARWTSSSGPRHSRSNFRRLGWRGLVAAAAVLGTIVLGPRLLAPRFPAYEIAIVPQGEATERSIRREPLEAPPATPALFHPGTAFEVAVRPLFEIEDLHGTLEVRCLLQAGNRLRAWPSCAERAEIAPTQAVRIAGTVGADLALEPGTWTLWIVLGRQGETADVEHHPSLLQGELVAKRSWIALRVPRPLRMEPLP